MLVNGNAMDFENISILQLLDKLQLDMNKVVVEVNFEIISKESYCDFALNEEDQIEIISLVGGG